MRNSQVCFSDIYDWAGELRSVNIAKGNQFCNHVHLVTYAEGVFSKLKSEQFLRKTSAEQIPNRFAYYLSEINVLHPFREGNGRTQRLFIEYVAQKAGWHIDFSSVRPDEMIEACAMAYAIKYDRMVEMLKRITLPTYISGF
ncbi:MAG: Fic family protein [Clostridiales bacterium]|nr:Fic family protein [Clostridiales bacterium]